MIGKAKFTGQGFKVTYSDLKDSRYTKQNKSIYVIQGKKIMNFHSKEHNTVKLTYNYQTPHEVYL